MATFRRKPPPNTQHPIGLEEVYRPSSDPAKVDIIFVHGLNGHRQRTWTHETSGAFWPKDLLPSRIKRSRVFTYGYDARVTSWLETVSTNRIDDHAKTFLMDLADFRHLDGTNNRPIILIGHSLGGLISKDMLLASRNSAEAHERKIIECTKGIIFMGTPHSGSGFAKWAEGLAAALTPFNQTNKSLLTSLRSDSEVLQRINTDFQTMVRRQDRPDDTPFSIICFYEEQPLKAIRREVVPKHSAILDAYPHAGIPSNHMDMVRFNKDDIGFQRVSQRLQIWVQLLEENSGQDTEVFEDLSPSQTTLARPLGPIEKECLQSLAFPEMDNRMEEIKRPAKDTCEWLSRHLHYQEWISKNSGLLWIKGKPGAGKSTLLKHIIQSSNLDSETHGSLCLYFFFHRRGTELQRTPQGLFRSLLYHLLHQAPDTCQELVHKFKQRRDLFGMPGQKWNWIDEELHAFLELSLPRAATMASLTLFVDALDECGESNAVRLVRSFYDLIKISNDDSKLKICLSSRHYPILTLNSAQEIRVEEENGNDIAAFLKTELLVDDPGDSERSELIAKRANGSFQWASLISEIVLTLKRRGNGNDAIDEKVQEVPSDLNGLYRNLLQSLDPEERFQSLKLFRWICFAHRPLNLPEIRLAMVLDVRSSSDDQNAIFLANRFVDNDDSLQRRVVTVSRGLAEIYNYSNTEKRVQLIHQSVRDFLVLENGLDLLEDSPSLEGTHGQTKKAHHLLSRSCLKLQSTDTILKSLKDVMPLGCDTDDLDHRHPLLHYAARYWIEHSIEAGSHVTPIDELIEILGYPSNAFLLNCIRTRRIFGDHKFSGLNSGSTFLHFATVIGLIDFIVAILDRMEKSNEGPDYIDSFGRTPLSHAAERGFDAAVEVFLNRGADVDQCDFDERTPLLYAARGNQIETVNLLLSKGGADLNHYDVMHRSALSYAAEAGAVEVVKLLLAKDSTDVNSVSNQGRTPFHFALQYGGPKVTEMLLPYQKDINLPDIGGETPIQIAVERGYSGIVKRMLSWKNLDTRPFSEQHPTMLKIAVRFNHLDIARQLLTRSEVDVNLAEPLVQAVRGGRVEMVRLLLSRRDIDVNAKDYTGDSALVAAALNTGTGVSKIIQILLERKDIDVNQHGGRGMAPLAAATRVNSLWLVKQLSQRKDIDFNSKNRFDETPLLLAASDGSSEIAVYLLSFPAVMVNFTDRYGRTALDLATLGGCTDIIAALLKRSDLQRRISAEKLPFRQPLDYGFYAYDSYLEGYKTRWPSDENLNMSRIKGESDSK